MGGLRLRLATADDAAGVRRVYAPYVTDTVVSFELDVPGPDELAQRISGRLPRHPWLVATDGEGAVVGYAYAGPFSARAAYDWSVETSVYLDAAQHRRGLGRALYTALFALLEAQGHRRAMAGITLPNAASVGLHEAMGFSAVGVYRAVGWKFDAWHDVGWWQRPIGPADGTPPTAGPVGLDRLDPAVLDAALAAGAAALVRR